MATPTTLPASFTAGQVLTAAQMNNLRGAFRVLQVVNAQYSTEVTSTTSTAITSGLSATITPSSTSSKILISYSFACQKTGASSQNSVGIQLRRGASSIQAQANVGYMNLASELYLVVPGIYLDSPNTTSATTYELFFFSGANTASALAQPGSNISNITLMEISA
jgi:hypothetical protein